MLVLVVAVRRERPSHEVEEPVVRGDEEIVEILNAVLTNELTSINQYFLHYRMQKHWGYHRLADRYYRESIGEMKHADELIHRVLYLAGHPNLQRLHSLRAGETVPEMIELDRGRELDGVELLRTGVALSRAKGDVNSALLLERILHDEEEHIDWLESQLDLIRQVGSAEYLSAQIHH
jgi:bacterioferritin